MIEPYFETELGKLYHGDYKNIIDTIQHVDISITDPPYGINYQSNMRKNKFDIIKNDNFFPVSIIDELLNITHKCVYIFCRWDNLSKVKKPKSFIVWDKNNNSMGDLKHEHARCWEGILFYPCAKHQFIQRPPDVIRVPKVAELSHPNQKPVSLIKWLIKMNTIHKDVIFDPFLGSGTTAIACEQLQHKWIGIEISKEYCDIAIKRIKQETTQLKLGI